MMSITNITKLIMASTLTCMVCACDFAEKNIDPNSPTSIEPNCTLLPVVYPKTFKLEPA